jgi:hypothetical protein
MPDWLGQAIIKLGTAEVDIRHNLPAVTWEIEQVSVAVGPVSTTANVTLKKNSNLVTPTSILSPLYPTGVGSTAGQDPYVYLQASDTMQIIVSGATNNDTMTVRAQYREYDSSHPAMYGR